MRSFLFFILGSVLCFGCGDDELEGTKANIITDKDQVYFQGEYLMLEAIFKNDLGLRRIEIVNEKLDIAFEKDLGGEISYHLQLELALPNLHSPEIHEVVITVTDMGDEVKNFSYEVDYVFLPEIFNMDFSLARIGDGTRYFQARLEDPHGIKSLQLHSLRMGVLISVQFPKGVHFYNLNEPFWYPTDEELGNSPLTLQITNQRNFNTTITDFRSILGN